MASKYDQKTKDEVIAFIKEYNAENGRGGQSAAVSKWNLNAVTVKSWLEKAGVATPGRGGKRKVKGKGGRPAKAAKAAKPGRKPGRKPGGRRVRPAVPSVGDLSATLNRMVAIRGEIAALEGEYAKLKASL